jgi:hypothetical protein
MENTNNKIICYIFFLHCHTDNVSAHYYKSSYYRKRFIIYNALNHHRNQLSTLILVLVAWHNLLPVLILPHQRLQPFLTVLTCLSPTSEIHWLWMSIQLWQPSTLCECQANWCNLQFITDDLVYSVFQVEVGIKRMGYICYLYAVGEVSVHSGDTPSMITNAVGSDWQCYKSTQQCTHACRCMAFLLVCIAAVIL